MNWCLMHLVQVLVPAVETALQETEDEQPVDESEEQQVLDHETAGTASQSLMLDQILRSLASSASWPAGVLLGPTDPDNPEHLESMQRQDWMNLRQTGH